LVSQLDPPVFPYIISYNVFLSSIETNPWKVSLIIATIHYGKAKML
jgi:hypothetical protein